MVEKVYAFDLALMLMAKADEYKRILIQFLKVFCLTFFVNDNVS